VIHEPSAIAVAIFAVFVAITLGISFWMGAQAKSASGYFAAGGQIHWFVNGVAFAGDYLSAASFLGICGMIAFFGYDGFLYSIGYLAGWIVALLVVAEPLKRLGRFTFADALSSKFQSRGITLAAGISTLVVSLFYLIPQMVGAGALVKPLLGFPHWAGVMCVGAVVIAIVVTAGMVSTTWVQFIKGSLLVFFSVILTGLILSRGLEKTELPSLQSATDGSFQSGELKFPAGSELPAEGAWKDKPYRRFRDPATGIVHVFRKHSPAPDKTQWLATQTLRVDKAGVRTVNGKPQGTGAGEGDFKPVGDVTKLAGGADKTGSLNPVEFLSAIHDSEIALWASEVIKDDDGSTVTVYYPKPTPGSDILSPGNHPSFKGLRTDSFTDKLNFLSLMLALFCGTASLPHILIRYYTVKDQAAARKSTVVGIGSIGFFYVLTLFLGLGAMTSGALDVTNTNMAAPLLAKSFGPILFAVISAIAFTTVLGTVSGLIVAAGGAVVHDLMKSVMRIEMTDYEKVRSGKIASIVVGVLAVGLGIVFEKMNVNYLVGWAFSIAASANLPALVMLLFWKGTTKQGISSAVIVGMVSSLGWILLSGDTYKDVYGLDPAGAIVPFSQPGIVTIPLGFAVLVAVSLMTQKPAEAPALPTAQ